MATGSPQVTVECMKDHPVRVGNFGANGKEPQTAVTVGAAVASTAATNSSPYGFSQAQADAIVARLNEIRAALIACGLLA